MPDTHDERGGDKPTGAPVKPWWEMPLGEEREVAKWNACWPDFDCDHDHDEGDRILRGRELNELREQLATATARAEKAEARLAELGEWETEQRIIGVSGLASTPTQFDLEHRADWCPGVRLEERQVHATPWRVVADPTFTNQPSNLEKP